MSTVAVDEPATLYSLAERALAEGDEPFAIDAIERYVRRQPADARALHWLALLWRARDRRDIAVPLLERAMARAPDDAAIRRAIAHVRLEAGLPATRWFLEAIARQPGDSELRLALASARYAEGEGLQALDELDRMLAANHGWYRGHRQFAQLASMVGRADLALSTIDRTIAAFPQSIDPDLVAIDLLLDAGRVADARSYVDRAVNRTGDARPFGLLDAVIEDELGHLDRAAERFSQLGPAVDIGHRIRRARHLIRRGALDEAQREIEPALGQPGDAEAWPYAWWIWRVTGNARAEWLDCTGQATGVVDLGPDRLDIAGLAITLRALHDRGGRFFNQSVRSGTQTDGPLFARIDPAIAAVREVVRAEVETFARGMPDADASHPLLRQARDRWLRFSGSWSVRLAGDGYHASHHHPKGWLSGVLYIEVPPAISETSGHLLLGCAPENLGIATAPMRTIAPSPGRLVLFPSCLWHGTQPSIDGHRVTIAFDVAPEGFG